MSGAAGEVSLWLTPKVFDDLTDPRPAVGAVFDHYAAWLRGTRLTVVFCTGNGDYVLSYAGPEHRADRAGPPRCRRDARRGPG